MAKNERDHFRYGYEGYEELRRKLRKEMTPAEKKLWQYLRAGRLEGLKFRRQHGISNWIVDFYHGKSRTVIELDGNVHDDEEVKFMDRGRQEWLEAIGCTVLRFRNEEVMSDVTRVLNIILHHIKPLP